MQALGAEPTEIEQNFKQAITIAKEQNTPMLELHASLSLAKYWQESKKEEAHSLLTKLLDQITPMVDVDEIPEYSEAKEMLVKLGK